MGGALIDCGALTNRVDMVNENTFIAKSLTPLCPQSLCPDMFSEIERSTLFLMRVGAETAAAAAAVEDNALGREAGKRGSGERADGRERTGSDQ